MNVPSSRAIEAATYRVPSLGIRILAGAARFVALLIVLVGLPVVVLAYLADRGVNLPVTAPTLLLGGVLVSGLSTAGSILRPTRAYGPVSVATSAAAIGYLFAIGFQGTLRVAVPGTTGSLVVGYAGLFDLVLLVPVLALGAGLVTAIEDLRAPGERLPFEYPP